VGILTALQAGPGGPGVQLRRFPFSLGSWEACQQRELSLEALHGQETEEGVRLETQARLQLELCPPKGGWVEVTRVVSREGGDSDHLQGRGGWAGPPGLFHPLINSGDLGGAGTQPVTVPYVLEPWSWPISCCPVGLDRAPVAPHSALCSPGFRGIFL
jgi:hypothetical protein